MTLAISMLNIIFPWILKHKTTSKLSSQVSQCSTPNVMIEIRISLSKLLMLMSSILLAISGCDTLRPHGT